MTHIAIDIPLLGFIMFNLVFEISQPYLDVEALFLVISSFLNKVIAIFRCSSKFDDQTQQVVRMSN